MDRRRNRRWPRQLEVRFWKHHEEGQPQRAISTNISRTGIFVRTQTVMPSGTRLRLEIGHSGRSMMIEGVVMRALKSPAHLQSVMPSGMGVRFLIPEELLSELLPGVDLAAEERIPTDVSRPLGGTFVSSASMAASAAASASSARPAAEPAAAPQPAGGAEAAAAPRPAPAAPGMASSSSYPLRFRDAEQFRRAFERDVQTGGLFISTERPAALDAVIQVEVTVDTSPAPPVRLQARVVHRMEPPPGSSPGNLLAGMGVQFLDVTRAVEQLRSLLV